MEARSAERRVCLSEQPRLLSTESDARGVFGASASHLEVIGGGSRGGAVTEPLPGTMDNERREGARRRSVVLTWVSATPSCDLSSSETTR